MQILNESQAVKTADSINSIRIDATTINPTLVEKVIQKEISTNPLPQDAVSIALTKDRAENVVKLSTSIGRYAYTGQLTREEALAIYRSIERFL